MELADRVVRLNPSSQPAAASAGVQPAQAARLEAVSAKPDGNVLGPAAVRDADEAGHDSGAAMIDPADDALDPGDRSRPLIARLFGAVANSRTRLAVSILLAFCATFAAVALMGASSWLLAFAATIPPVLFLESPAVIVRFFALSRGIFRYGERLASHDVALRMQSALRLETYRRLAQTTLLGSRRGDLLTRMIADVEAIQDLIVRVWIPFASSGLVILVACGLIALISPGSALILLASAVLAGLLVPVIARKASERADRAAVPARGKLADQVHELANTAADLVAYGADAQFTSDFQATDLALRRMESRSTWVRGLAEGSQMVAAGAAVIGAIMVGATQIRDFADFWTPVPLAFQSVFADPNVLSHWPGITQVGFAFLAVLALTPLALHESLNSLARSAQTVTRARVALRRVEDVLDAPVVGSGDIPARLETKAAPMLRVDGLSVGWPGFEPVLSGLSLEVRAGEKVAVTGPSGVGKTTLAATVLGLIDPVAGKLELVGRPGYLAQDAHIFNTTVAENVKIGNRDATEADVVQALERAGLGGLDPSRIVGERGSALSGGEARRLALARILVGSYQVLILDEPTEHLDQLTAAALLDDIWETAADLPVLVITHDREVMARCDRIVRLGADQVVSA
jgi:thiol reductant ABC exporter CydC subunit